MYCYRVEKVPWHEKQLNDESDAIVWFQSKNKKLNDFRNSNIIYFMKIPVSMEKLHDNLSQFYSVEKLFFLSEIKLVLNMQQSQINSQI